MLFIIPILSNILFSAPSFAEQGCLVPGYTELLIRQDRAGAPYFNSPNLPAPLGCEWILISFISGCIGHGKGGIKGEFELQCPLDDNVTLILVLSIAIALLKLKAPNIT